MLIVMITDPKCPQCKQPVSGFPFWKAPRFLRCQRCGIIFRDPMPDVQSLVAVYTTSWESPETNTRETGSTDAPIAHSLLSSLTKTMEMNLSGLRILDYGAGRGAMSKALIDKGADVNALE